LVDGESESSVHTKSTPMKVTFTNTDVKKSFMKQLSKLKDVDESSPFKSISISHDMTKNERDQNKAMFEETKISVNTTLTFSIYQYFITVQQVIWPWYVHLVASFLLPNSHYRFNAYFIIV
jgi:hypothetical protein